MPEDIQKIRDFVEYCDLLMKDVQEALDDAVRKAHGMSKTRNPFEFLLALNVEVSAKEILGEPVIGPGLPAFVTDPTPYITAECISMPSKTH